MKIAIVCPIGDLERFGYWRVAQTCLESWQALGDLFLIHSSRMPMPFGIQSTYIRDGRTLMQMVDGIERFDYRLVANNANRGMSEAQSAGYDVALTICVNWYVEHAAAQHIAEKCQRLFESGGAYDFLCRRIQINTLLFDADLRSIAVFNLERISGDVVKVLVDRAEIDGVTISGSRGDFAVMNDAAYIDCEHELTMMELLAKLADVRNYEDILPKRSGVDWSFWERYYTERAVHMIPALDAPGPIGQRIAERHPVSAFGDWLLEQMKVST